MSARILVVDDIVANVKLLEARLTAEYFEVLTAHSGPEALAICARERADVVLLDVMMPGMDGFEVCRRLKADPATSHIPVVMVTALDQPADRVQGLQAGADDFLTKPVDDIALVTRVRNLARVKMLNDELMMRAATSAELGVHLAAEEAVSDVGGKILLVDDHPRSAQRLCQVLEEEHETSVVQDPNSALLALGERPCDVLMVTLNLQHSDGLRLCAQVRSLERSRHLPIILIVEPGDDARLLRGLDMGVNDYLVRPIDRNEMLARVRTQIRRKRYTDLLKTRLEESAELAVTDALTGLHNRRYMDGHLKALVDEARKSGRPLAVAVADLDHFRQLNAEFGPEACDAALQEFAARLKKVTRGIDLACRMIGEKFVIILPDTTLDRAQQVAERVRSGIAGDAIPVNRSGTTLSMTVSLGVAIFEYPDDTAQSVLLRAEKALHRAKDAGRNRVAADAA